MRIWFCKSVISLFKILVSLIVISQLGSEGKVKPVAWRPDADDVMETGGDKESLSGSAAKYFCVSEDERVQWNKS